MVEIGKRLRNLRESKRMTQKEIAEKLNVTPQTISKWERDKSQPDLQTLLELSAFFDVSIDELLGNKRVKKPKLNFWKGRDKMTKEKQDVKKNNISREEKPVIAIMDITANLSNKAGQPYTQLLATRLEKWLKEHQKNLRVETYCSNFLNQVGNCAQLLLLAPNFSYPLKEIQEKFPHTPILAISDKDYGTLNVEKIGNQIERALQPVAKIPKAHKVSTTATFLKIEFDNGEIKYLRSHLSETMTRSLSGKNWQKLLIAPTVAWLGTDVQIKPCGQVILNEKDTYSPEELWYNSVYHIQDL